MPHLARLSATPIKSLGLSHPPSAVLTGAGIPGNRRFHLADSRGRLFTGADHGPLVRLIASFDPGAGTLTVAFPDGSVVAGAADRLGPAVVTDFWGRSVPGRVVEGPLAGAIGDWAGHRLRLIRADLDGDGSDVERLSLVSLASVRDLGARDGRPDLDPRRFRMNLELDGCEPYEEDTWAGRGVRIGLAVVRVLGQVPRCVVTTQDPRTGEKDFDTLKRIAAYRPLMHDPRGVPFGMYAEVAEPGRVAVGDSVEVLAP
jgi:uncharacterized protein YcbX